VDGLVGGWRVMGGGESVPRREGGRKEAGESERNWRTLGSTPLQQGRAHQSVGDGGPGSAAQPPGSFVSGVAGWIYLFREEITLTRQPAASGSRRRFQVDGPHWSLI
jgi:hypothetical protein